MVGEKGTVFPTLFSSPPTESPVDSGDSLKGRRNPGEGRGGFVHKVSVYLVTSVQNSLSMFKKLALVWPNLDRLAHPFMPCCYYILRPCDNGSHSVHLRLAFVPCIAAYLLLCTSASIILVENIHGVERSDLCVMSGKCSVHILIVTHRESMLYTSKLGVGIKLLDQI
ncbi:hypothetical protein U9M48_010732 [Paspalum notatum var. saurae]|uniref:Uncharacterized protein n=1 Tax=Paspalum notatum var. saurae TaxID=547442 RepID=A0AAQ3SU83_PASNO